MNLSANTPLRKLLGNVQFRWLISGNTAMFFGFFGTTLLRSLLAWDLTQDEMALAYINLLMAVCMFVSSVLAGALIDRYERKKLLLISQVLVVTAEIIVTLLLVTDQLSFSMLMIMSTVSSFSFPFIMPARTAMLVEAVGKSRLGKATALMTAGLNLARMISPAAVGVLADVSGFVLCYALVIICHCISLGCTLGLEKQVPASSKSEGFIKDTFRGFGYIVEHRSIGLCILFGILPLLIVIPLQNLMVVFVDSVWQRGGSGLGIMMAAMGIGGVVGSLTMTLVREGSLVRPMISGTLVMAVALMVFAHLSSFWLAVFMVLIIYSASVLSQTLVQTAVQLMSEDFIRGRITTITMMSISISPVGTLAIAYATREIGAPWAMTWSGVILIISVILIWCFVPSFRRIDQVANSYGKELQ